MREYRAKDGPPTECCFHSERIDIAIDPFTGRNPSYCFVDLETKELAERAMTELDGHDMLGRPVKIKPGVVKSQSERSQQSPRAEGSPRANKTTSPFGVDRWRRDDSAPAPVPAAPVFQRTNSDSSRRLYVGGLPRISEQETIQSNITSFFKGFNMYVLSALSQRQFDTDCPPARTLANCFLLTLPSGSSLVTTTTCSSTSAASKRRRLPWTP